MSNPEREEVITSEYRRARDIYSTAAPTYRGNLVLSQNDALTLPIDLTAVYGLMSQQIDRNPREAASYARTFGATRVMLALDNRSTCFEFEKYGAPPNSSRAEISTCAVQTLGSTICAQEVDAPLAYLLADSGEPQTVEMSLVQAMHMVDTAMATGLYERCTPLVRRIDIDNLLALKEQFPDVFLRTYGNVRGLSNAPLVLGTVVCTKQVEESNITTERLGTAPTDNVVQRERIVLPERKPAAFVGITTAKRPHIGHGLLLTKAIADTSSGMVLIELNDQGPRVEQAIIALAEAQNRSVKDTVAAIERGEVAIEDIEKSYQARDTTTISSIDVPYGLAPNNRYYRELLAALEPPRIAFETIANSEMGGLRTTLTACTGSQQLFSGAGMNVLQDGQGSAMVTERAGKPTLQGSIAQLALAYELKMVDSPSALNRQEIAILRGNGLALETGSGCGLLLDFSSASGTNGRSIPLESLVRPDLPPGTVLAAMRKVMDRSTFFVSETGSLCPNFADNGAFMRAYERELGNIDPSEITNIVSRPMKFQYIQKVLLQELFSSVYATFPVDGKIKAGEVCRLLNLFPVLAKKLPGKVVAAAANLDSEVSIPRNLYKGDAQKLLQSVRTQNPDTVVQLLSESCENEDMYLSNYLQNTGLGEAISQMGYVGGSTMEAVKKIIAAKGVYKIL